MSLKHKVSALEVAMRGVVREAAEKQGPLRLHTHYADNYWTVTVHGDGTTQYENYAEEARGPRGKLEELSLWELASLLERVA